MIKDAHGKGGVEGFKIGWQILHPDRQQIDGDIAQVVLDAEELEHEQQPRVYADHPARAFAQHAPAVVPGAAAHIQYAATGEV